ncbi:MAG: hypothetical protein JW850_20905 [Thermoflexales bacterium]|nr:hypothetical protein [Thermoflexales bacterium]
MVVQWLLRLTPWLLSLLTLGFFLTLWAAWRAFKASRSGMYYAIREQARVRGFRLGALAASILLTGIAVGLCSLAMSRRASVLPVASSPSVTPSTVPIISGATLLPDGTPSPTPTTKLLPTQSPTPSPPSATPTPTRIPRSELPPTILTPLPSAATADPNTRVGPITFALPSADKTCSPTQAGPATAQFEVGTSRICAYFPVRNMKRGTPWTAAWYKDGQYVDGSTLLWDAPSDVTGTAFYATPGRQPGPWELRLYVEDRLFSTGVFTVGLPAQWTTPTPSPTPSPSRTPSPTPD